MKCIGRKCFKFSLYDDVSVCYANVDDLKIVKEQKSECLHSEEIKHQLKQALKEIEKQKQFLQEQLNYFKGD